MATARSRCTRLSSTRGHLKSSLEYVTLESRSCTSEKSRESPRRNARILRDFHPAEAGRRENGGGACLGASFFTCERQSAVAPMRESVGNLARKRRGGRLGTSRGESWVWAKTSPVVGLWGSWEVPDWTKLPRSACPVCVTTRPAIPASLRPTFSGTFDLGPLSNFMLFTTRLSTFCALDAERGALSPLARLPLVRTHISSLSSASYAFLATSRWF